MNLRHPLIRQADFLTKRLPPRDFGPAFGLAWSPVTRSGWLERLFGGGNTFYSPRLNAESFVTNPVACD